MTTDTEDITATIHVRKCSDFKETGTAKDPKAAMKQAICEYSKKKYNDTYKDSNIADKSADFPKFLFEEVEKGKVLGKGGFGTVWEVKGFHVNESQSENPAEPEITPRDDMESRKFISEHAMREVGGARYAVKMLSPEVIQNNELFLQGMYDMATETRILSSIMHPNIVKLRAIAQGTWFDETYFIVMDRLCDTLETRLEKWSRKQKRLTGIAGSIIDRKGKKKAKLYEKRIVAAFDLSSALAYLHKQLIIHRDIKPENIGFDIRGDIKIFDFGLSKEIPLEGAFDGGLFKFTEMTGSPRYMAPGEYPLCCCVSASSLS